MPGVATPSIPRPWLTPCTMDGSTVPDWTSPSLSRCRRKVRCGDEPHCLITPHVAGGNHLEKTSEHIIRIALTNVSRYAKQQELLNLVRY